MDLLKLMPKDKIINYFAEKFLEEDDKSLIAYYDKNNDAKVKIFKFNILEVIEKMRKDLEFLENENKILKDKLNLNK